MSSHVEPQAPAWMGLHHVNVRVTDLEAARRFYSDKMGFAEIPRPPSGSPGAWFAIGPSQLHISEDHDHVTPGRQHFAICVGDLDRLIARLQKGGVPVRTTPGTPLQAFVRDPSGNMIEIREPQ